MTTFDYILSRHFDHGGSVLVDEVSDHLQGILGLVHGNHVPCSIHYLQMQFPCLFLLSNHLPIHLPILK